MSRIGKKQITIPGGVTVNCSDNTVSVKGPKGQLSERISPLVSMDIQGAELTVTRADDASASRAQHGLCRTLIHNMVVGVTQGYSRKLEIVGVGYRAEVRGKALLLNVGYSHPIMFFPPEDITLEAPTQTTVVISGINKQLVGQVAAKIRSFRKPEPYKGKGIKYENEFIRRKAGKSAGK